jgi:hypothetical protein
MAKQRYNRHGQPIPADAPLYIIWKLNDFRGEYEAGNGYAAFLPTDLESAEWHCAKVQREIRERYHWQPDATFAVLPYKEKAASPTLS